jgi:ATP/ADP translocase
LNRYLALCILAIIYSFSCSFIDYPQAIDVQEINHVENQNSDYPIDDTGKLKNINVIMVTVLVMIILIITSSFNMISILTRRLMLITTIFYQSNYVINSFEISNNLNFKGGNENDVD